MLPNQLPGAVVPSTLSPISSIILYLAGSCSVSYLVESDPLQISRQAVHQTPFVPVQRMQRVRVARRLLVGFNHAIGCAINGNEPGRIAGDDVGNYARIAVLI